MLYLSDVVCTRLFYTRKYFVSFNLFHSPFVSPSLLFEIQIRGYIAGRSPLSPLRLVPSVFIAGRFHYILPSSTRVELGSYPRCLPVRALSTIVDLVYFGNNKLEVSPRWESNSRTCLLYTSPSPRDQRGSRMPSSA